jgi:hypothetical protein
MTPIEQADRKLVDPLCVSKSRAVESLGWLLTHSPLRFPPQTACRKADAQRLSAMTHGQAAASARLLASHEFSVASSLCILGHFQGFINLDSQIPHRAFNFCMTK